PPPGRDRGQRRRPPARHQQEPPADRAVEARQPEVGPAPGRRPAVDPVSGRIDDASGGVAHRRTGPVNVSNVPRPGLGVSSSVTSGAPSASLRLGAAGPAGPLEQTPVRTVRVLAWFALLVLITSSGTPHAVLWVSR